MPPAPVLRMQDGEETPDSFETDFYRLTAVKITSLGLVLRHSAT